MKKAISIIAAAILFSFAGYKTLAQYPGGITSFRCQEEGRVSWGFHYKEETVIPCRYDAVDASSEGLTAVNIGGKASYNGSGSITTVKGGKWGYVSNTTGKEVIPCKYDAVREFNGGLAVVNIGGEKIMGSISRGKFGFVDKAGKEIIPLKYDFAYDFSEGLAVVGLIDKCGFIDKTGSVVIPLKYDAAAPFSEGLAAVMLNDKWGFINKTGAVVISLKYDEIIEDFSDGVAMVALDGREIKINKKGKEVDN